MQSRAIVILTHKQLSFSKSAAMFLAKCFLNISLSDSYVLCAIFMYIYRSLKFLEVLKVSVKVVSKVRYFLPLIKGAIIFEPTTLAALIL